MSTSAMHMRIDRVITVLCWLFLWLAMALIALVENTSCTQGSDDPWFLTLAISLPISFMVLAIQFTRNVNAKLFFTLPLAPLVFWAGYIAIKYTVGMTIQSQHPCVIATGNSGFNEYIRSWWVSLWGPMQLLFLSALSCYLIYGWLRLWLAADQ